MRTDPVPIIVTEAVPLVIHSLDVMQVAVPWLAVAVHCASKENVVVRKDNIMVFKDKLYLVRFEQVGSCAVPYRPAVMFEALISYVVLIAPEIVKARQFVQAIVLVVYVVTFVLGVNIERRAPVLGCNVEVILCHSY
jgi:hypothetical protein